VRHTLAHFCREPLIHFLAIGAVFFLYWHFAGDRLAGQSQSIFITPAQVERIAQVWAKTHLRPPTAEELAGLVEQEIDEEILYRQAVALGLDRDDLVIRRRLATKMEFLTDDLAEAANPTDEQLQAFLLQHPEKFSLEPLTSFRQIYLDRSKRGDKAAADAENLLAQLNGKSSADWKTLGDPLPLPNEFSDAAPVDVARALGREYPKKLAQLPVGRWSGPVESGFGLHLVQVQGRKPGKAQPLAEVREAVLNEWRTAKRQELAAKFRQQRRASFAVNVEWPDWASEAARSSGSKALKGAP
jgi:PPIC-type PPIASE domain